MMQDADIQYTPRLLDSRLQAVLDQAPAVLVVGPRAAGKTTTASRLARTVVRLDREAEAIPFRADPDAALRGLEEPILLDEWQEVPQVLGAVKRSVDDDPRPRRFLVTGSVRAEMGTATWPGTGRLVRLTLYGITVREARGQIRHDPLIKRLADAGTDAISARIQGPPDLHDYLHLLASSGFPEPLLRLSENGRREWLRSYVEQILTRDVELIDPGRDPARIRRFLTAYAASTAQVVDDKTLWEAAGIDRRTALAYENLLRNLFVADTVAAWSSNRLKRLIRLPKRHLVDPAIGLAVLRLTPADLLRDGTLLGPFLETFVAAQIRAETTAQADLELHHLRVEGGRHEVDLIAEVGAGNVVGIEVKATAAPDERDARHLTWMRDQLGARFRAGVILHTGPATYTLGERIVAAPIAELWT